MSIGEVKERYTQVLLNLPNVVSLGIGEKREKGKGIYYIAIIVYVSKKLPEIALQTADIIPKMLSGYHTDVIEWSDKMELHRQARSTEVVASI